MAILSWALGEMMRVDLPLLQALSEELVRRITEFSSQHLMNFGLGLREVEVCPCGGPQCGGRLCENDLG